jgi:hypothetical protein
LVTTVEAERISSLPRLPRRKQNTNVGVGNGSRAFRTMMKAMREALQNEQIQKQLERDGGSAAGAGGAAAGAGVGGKETHDIALASSPRGAPQGGTVSSARACARREAVQLQQQARGQDGITLISSFRSPISAAGGGVGGAGGGGGGGSLAGDIRQQRQQQHQQQGIAQHRGQLQQHRSGGRR